MNIQLGNSYLEKSLLKTYSEKLKKNNLLIHHRRESRKNRSTVILNLKQQ